LVWNGSWFSQVFISYLKLTDILSNVCRIILHMISQ
jgi:hypothetical protein